MCNLHFFVQPSLNLSVPSTPMSYSNDGSSLVNRFCYIPKTPMNSAHDADTREVSSSYAGANSSPSPATVQHQATHSRLPLSRPKSLAMSLRSSLPLLDSNLGSAVLRPSPLSPRDTNVLLDNFSDGFEDEFDQFLDDCYIVGDEQNNPSAHSEVSCTAVFRAGEQNTHLVWKNREAKEKKPDAVKSADDRWRLPFANRKRIIDEIFEDCGEAVKDATPPKKRFSIASEHQDRWLGRDVMENEWQVEESSLTESRRDEIYIRTSYNLPSLSHKLATTTHSRVNDKEPSLSRKLALKSGSVESPPPQSLSAQQAVKTLSSGSPKQLPVQSTYELDPSSSLPPPLQSKPIPCSFFTAGPTRL